jgi:hypothetical protein
VNQIKKNSLTKQSAGVAGIVGAGATYAALQNAGAEGAAAEPISAAAAPDASATQMASAEHLNVNAAAQQPVEQLVQSYLGEGQTVAMGADGLTAADMADMAAEPEMLNTLAAYPSVDGAQMGSGEAAGGLVEPGGFFFNIGQAMGLSGTAAGIGGLAAGIGGGLLVGAGLDNVINC